MHVQSASYSKQYACSSKAPKKNLKGKKRKTNLQENDEILENLTGFGEELSN